MKQVTKQTKSHVSMFLYGLAGAGKTHIISTLLKDKTKYPIVVLSCDSGYLSIVDHIGPNMAIFETYQLSEVQDVVTKVVLPKKESIKTVVIDNITELHRTEMQFNKISNAADGLYEQRDYGVARQKMLKMCNQLSKQPFNLVVTALAQERQEGEHGKVEVRPDVAGKLSGEVPSYFDIVAYLDTVHPTPQDLRTDPKAVSQRVMYFNPTPRVAIARNRKGKLPNAIANPSLPEIFNKVLS